MLDDDDAFAEFEQKSALQRWGLPVGGGIAIVVAGVSIYVLLKGNKGPAPRPHNEPHITQVQLPPPPPPPPPPKTPPPPKKPEEAPKQREPTLQKAMSKPAPKAPSPPASVTTSIAGPGTSGLGVGNDGGGLALGGGNGDGSGGNDDAYYSNLVQTQIKSMLERDERLRYAKYSLTVTFSLDASGHPVGLKIASFTGDEDLRAQAERDVQSASTGDTPSASIVGRPFTVRIIEHARG